MSDDDYETTEVAVAKPKKERTPAQKAATARALEALAAAREAKKGAKAPTVVKRTTTTTKTVAPKPVARNTITYDEEEEAPVYVKPRALPKPAAPDYGEDIRSLTEGLNGVLTYIQRKETKKAKKAPVPVESSSEEEEPEPQPMRRKTKLMKAAPAPPEYQFGHKDPQEVLRGLFFRNN
jgi:hypothetical protein